MGNDQQEFVECYVEDRLWSTAGILVVLVAGYGLITLGTWQSAVMLLVGVVVALGRTRSRIDPEQKLHEVHWGIIFPATDVFVPVHQRTATHIGDPVDVRLVPGKRLHQVLLVHEVAGRGEETVLVGEVPDPSAARHLSVAVRIALGLTPLTTSSMDDAQQPV